MFFSVPIVNNRNRVIAILAKRIDFDGPFSSILSAGFIGKSGETYAINKSGILLSSVRFENDLKKIGLIHPKQRASLNLRIANPGENLIEKGTLTQAAANWPLTYMANQIALEKSGENFEGYNDYRGVTVVGSWLWDQTINMGLVAEIDAEESFALLTTFKNTIWTVMFITLLLLFGSTLFTLRVGTRATKTLARSHAQLEKIVDERTQALQTNMERTQSIIDNASDGIVVVDDNGQIIEFSPACEAIFGYRASDALEMNIYQLMNTPFHHKYIENKNNEETKLIELIGVRHDQSLIDIEVAVSETHNDGNVFYTGFIRNTTMRKEAERELKKAKAKAEEATQAKSDFLANMSHEIRTPMNAIIGMSYLALQTELSTKQEDYVNKIHSSAEALLGIINDILDFSKIEAGKMSIENTPFDLNETIGHLVQISSHKSQQKKLELLIDIDPQLPINLIGDPLRLGQILINLTNNAVKFTEQGEIIVRAKLKERHDTGDVLIEFSVEDSGIGMTEAQVDSLFQSFSQADASTTRKYGGTGLGLTISKTLTEMMGGKIWVESKYGHGSIFFFTAVFPVSPITSSKTLATPESLEHLPLLIVDDSKAARQILATLATSLSYKPEVASSGQEALSMLITAEQNDTPFSLVLADWKMPEMNGIELGKAIEGNNEIINKPKYIMVTAYDRDDMLAEADGLHIDGSLTKPVNASTLLDSIMTVMGSNAFHKQRKSITPVNENLTYGLAGAHLLLVEDNDINQQIAVELLSMAKINVDTAWNGEEAIEKINQNTYDAVLMDIQMPVMDGYTATELLRENPNHAGLIIIAMTANAMEGDRDKCLAVGMNDHLPKPIDPKQVFSVLSKWVKGKTNHVDDALLPTPENEQLTSDEELSFDLPGFDVSNAIMRMAGNKKLYQRTLERVAESQKDALIKTNQALSENNLKQAIIAIHTLRGVAANIGANFILENAEKIEILLCNVEDKGQPYDEQQVKKLLEQCSSQHHQMIETINLWLVKSKTVNQLKAKPKEAISEDALRESLLAIHEKLDSFDSSAIDDLEYIMSMAVPTEINNELKNIYEVVSQYDFETASEQLNLLITKAS
ncbi:hypothetical protein theurythT_27370 [Thalassotalea eurytherma]|uniref:histidine kinase n=1 Tax=Thalassotalea eurytherma TaxID=1144278 RepID=A0ABQ6H7T1_9GAMM|nr:hypothetical protein theurythT_27370 [Thalassotalea eurytherma]